MNFDIPQDLADYLKVLDQFIEDEIKPLEQSNDNIRFFDHRREDARTDWDRGGLPNDEWEDLLREAKQLADAAGHYRYALPKEFGGQDGTNLGMAVIREHLAAKGLGLHADLQNEHTRWWATTVGVILMDRATAPRSRKAEWLEPMLLNRKPRASPSALPSPITVPTRPTWKPTAVNATGMSGVINGEKTWNTGIHKAQVRPDLRSHQR